MRDMEMSEKSLLAELPRSYSFFIQRAATALIAACKEDVITWRIQTTIRDGPRNVPLLALPM